MELGDKIVYRPQTFCRALGPGPEICPETVTATVTYINIPHRYCTVEYELHGITFRESFKIINKSL